jgi:hypothetical protein
MPFNLLILPFLGGYIFVRFWNYTRIHMLRDDKDRIIIRASLAGLVSLCIAFALSIAARHLFPCGSYSICVSEVWRDNVPFEYSDVAIIAFVLAATAWKPLNYKWYDREDEIHRAIEEDADPLEMMLKRSKDEQITVAITMTNEKVYVGMVSQQFNPATPTTNIGLFPLQSGYRDPLTKQLHLKIDYSRATNRIGKELDTVTKRINSLRDQRAQQIENDPNSDTTQIDKRLANSTRKFDRLERTSGLFLVVLPVSQIASANFYDAYVYEKYFRKPLEASTTAS